MMSFAPLPRLFLVFIGVHFFTSTQAYAFCGTVEEDTQVVLNPSREVRFLKKGELVLVKGLSGDRSKFILNIFEESALIDKSAVQMMKKQECKTIFPGETSEFEWSEKDPEEVPSLPPAPKPRLELSLEPEVKKTRVVRKKRPVVTESAPIVEPEKKVEHRRSSLPSRPPPVVQRKAPAAPKDWSKEWRFGGEIGFGFNVSAEGYKGLVTKVPDPRDVGMLQDPVITGVERGQGRYFRGFAERHLDEAWVGQVGLGYRTQTLKYAAKKNPSDSPTHLEDLESFSQSFDERMVELGAGASYLYPWSSWTVGLGGQLDLVYSLSKEKTVDVLLPTVPGFKNTAGQVSGGPDSVSYLLKGKVDLRKKHFRGTLTMAVDASVFLSLGYLW